MPAGRSGQATGEGLQRARALCWKAPWGLSRESGRSIIADVRKILVFRHGFLANRYVMLPIERHFRRRGYEVHNRTYPSRRKLIEEHAEALAEELRRLDAELERSGVPHELYAVTHSMGGLILRYALAHLDVPPVKRAVLFAPPNQGAATARFFRSCFLGRWLFGTKAGRQLGEAPDGIFSRCGIPAATEIGILAGSVSWKLYPSRIEKPHDSIVSVAETALPPFPRKVLPYGHTPIILARRAWEEAESFLEHGKFRSDSP
jgi:triacylglycerol lipase